jgi:hypothetical protein
LIFLVTWSLAFAIPFAPVTVALLVGGGYVASLGSGGFIPIIAACSSPRIRSQSFAAFGLALAVLGAASAPAVVGGMSVLFQRGGMNEADALRYAMLIATVSVASLAVWFVYQASLSADEDAQSTIAAFIAEHTTQPGAGGAEPAGPV